MAGPGGGWTVHASSPRGEGQAPFVCPLERGEIEGLRRAFGRTPGRDLILQRLQEEEPEPSPESLGERLFEALFPGEIASLYERSLDLVGADPEAGLRLELMLDPRDPELAAFQELPWELLRQPGSPVRLALSRRRPFVRYPAVPRAIYTPRPVEVLRILAVASSPRDLEPLDLAREIRNLEEGARAAGHLEIVQPQAPTIAALRQACLEKEFQVLHFMGHGSAEPGGEGVLYFETEEGDADPVRGMDLVNKIADFFPTLRLIVLNACDSAAPGEGSVDPMSSVASSLVLGGLPAVVAMQLPISDQAAISFSRTFYQRLAAGDPLEAAVSEGRQAIHSKDPAGLEWAVPVLFLRSQEEAPAPPKVEASMPRRRAHWLTAAVVLGLLLTLVAVVGGRAWRKKGLADQGAMAFEQGDWAAARSRYQAALALAPTSAEILSNLAATEERLGELEAARDHYEEAVRQSPDSGEHLFNLGLFLNSNGRPGEAYPVLVRAVENEPERADAYGELAHAALDLGMPGRARAALKVALRLDPERAAPHRLLGDLELRSGHPRAALAALTAARRFPMADRDKAQTAWLLAQAHERLGDAAPACREIEELRRLDEPGILPWAPEAEALATKLGCSAP